MEANESLAYIAGFIDGEGCIRIGRGVLGPSGVSLHVVNSDEGVIDYINLMLPGRKYNKKRYGRKNLYRICWSGQDAINVIELVLPYLIVKRRLAELITEYWKEFFEWSEVDMPMLNEHNAFLKPVNRIVITEAEMILRKSYADRVQLLIDRGSNV